LINYFHVKFFCLNISSELRPGSVWCPEDSVDDDRGIGGKLVSKVGDVALWMLLQLLGIKAAAVFALKMILLVNLEQNKDCRMLQKAHVQEVVGSNPAEYWMDVSDASYYITYSMKKEIKVAKGGTPKNI